MNELFEELLSELATKKKKVLPNKELPVQLLVDRFGYCKDELREGDFNRSITDFVLSEIGLGFKERDTLVDERLSVLINSYDKDYLDKERYPYPYHIIDEIQEITINHPMSINQYYQFKSIVDAWNSQCVSGIFNTIAMYNDVVKISGLNYHKNTDYFPLLVPVFDKSNLPKSYPLDLDKYTYGKDGIFYESF